MKKLIILIFCVLSVTAFSQTGMNWKKFIVADTLAADSGYILATSGVYSSWNVTVTCGTHTSTSSTVKIQVSNDKTTWIDYADLPEQTLTDEGTVAFEDDYISSRWMRVYFTIESGKTVPISAYYVFKK